MTKKSWGLIAIGLAILAASPFVSGARSAVVLRDAPIFSVPDFSKFQNSVPKPTAVIGQVGTGDHVKIGGAIIMDSYLGYIIQTKTLSKGVIIFEDGAFREVHSPIRVLMAGIGSTLILIGLLSAGRRAVAVLTTLLIVIIALKDSIQDSFSKRRPAQTTTATVLFGGLYHSFPLRILPPQESVVLIRRVFAEDGEYDRVQVDGQKGYLDPSNVSAH